MTSSPIVAAHQRQDISTSSPPQSPDGGRAKSTNAIYSCIVRIALPPPRRAAQARVSFLTAICFLLSVWCYLHCDLLLADQPHQPVNFQDLIRQGKYLRDTGHVAQAISLFNSARDLAHQQHDYVFEAKIQILIGTAQTLLFKYGAALEALDRAAQIGETLHDDLVTGSANGNIATLYSQLGDLAAAEDRSSNAIRCLRNVKSHSSFSDDCLARSYLIHASICFELQRNLQGYNDYQSALSLAEARNDTSTQALILDRLGTALTREHRFAEANESLQHALTLSSKQPKDLNGLAFEKEHLAELELEKPNADYAAALNLINEAFSTSSPAFASSPQYYPLDIRGRILLQTGNKSAALAEFKRAVTAATQWRTSALPGDVTNIQTVQQIQNIYSDYAQLAAEIALETHDQALSISGLETLAENRAASLREQLRVVYGSNGQLPDEYFSKLALLQSAQAAVTLGKNTRKDKATLLRLRLDISDMENKIGLKSKKIKIEGERIPSRNSLRDIQNTLAGNQVLLSITLGKHRSYLWAVTDSQVNLTRLPGEEDLTSEAALFATAVRNDHDPSAYAERLSRSLFGGLPPDVWSRSEWILVAEGPLLKGIPFCALSNLKSGINRRLLIEDRTLRFLPSELLLADKQPSRRYRNFVGIGDPIYNQADSRIPHSGGQDAKTFAEGITLARLVGSEREIRAAAEEIGASETVLLIGPKATRENLTAALANNAGIVHFAVHVVSPPDEPQEAALALSLKNGIPELLTPESVASLRVPGSLVVLSGCSSGQGKVMPGAGLVGLSRAWLLAGAAAVVVSSWPTPDDSGKFFSSFYDHFDRITSGDIAQRAALALHRTQLDLLHGRGYQASPSFWGAFAVIAKE